jgi:hypothetical protein
MPAAYQQHDGAFSNCWCILDIARPSEISQHALQDPSVCRELELEESQEEANANARMVEGEYSGFRSARGFL